jgi:glutamate---methylamine ligase
MRHGRDPGPRLECNMYTEGHNYPDLKRLPLNLLDAIRLFEGSALAREGFGEELVTSYAKLKHGEWGRYCGVITEWERETTLDC